ncbi:ABC1 kinase family protein [Jongsikchunia kroppenstedtii]|uniref:ABC1 kinase family protein n=1 Tax=Jongsikchunia kroppenstedtii TaxID=1121721 RepID=UPI0003711570|nr:AarF/ABC1/UbiB kinase family protein [Jongsikchunia kroppenstedtii]
MPTAQTVRSGRIRRTVPIAGFAARSAGGRMVAGLRARTGDPDAVDKFHQRTAERYAEMLGHSKGVLMKAGQLLSTYDIDPDSGAVFSTYQKALQRLQSEAPPMEFETAQAAIEQDLGRPITELFEKIEETPLAAASIGQVHEAWLPDGTHVAVKVQYPGVARAIHDDLANTELLATFVKLGMSMTPKSMRTDQRAAAAEISERIVEEIDYRHEARSIRRFADLYRGHPFIRVPELIESHCGEQVLTMSYVEGVSWSEARNADQDLRNQWAEAISYFAFGAYRHSNLFNADPHPGNYRFGLDGTVGFVDFGCVKQFPERVRIGIVRMLRAAVNGDRDELYRVMRSSGWVSEDSDLTPDDVMAWWRTMAGPVLGSQPHRYTADDATALLQSLFGDNSASAAIRKMDVPPDYVMLSRINLGINAILAELGAELNVKAQSDDIDGIGEPLTHHGKLHVAWARERGLPFGLDPR